MRARCDDHVKPKTCAPQKFDGSYRIAHFQGFHLPELVIRIVDWFNHAMTILLIRVAVRSCLLVNPIFFRVTHAMTAWNLACRS